MRSFSKRFYKKIFKYRYSRNYAIQSKGILVSPVTAAISSTRLANNGYKPYFHLKTIFNLNEFLMYDFYNFHSKQISGKFLNNSKLSKVWTTKI